MDKACLMSATKMLDFLGYKILVGDRHDDNSWCFGYGFKFVYLRDKADIWHEAGHAFYNEYENRILRRGFKTVFGNKGTFNYISKVIFGLGVVSFKPGGDYPTDYAMTHPLEDFAECFQLLARKRWKRVRVKNKILQAKLDFVRDAVLEME